LDSDAAVVQQRSLDGGQHLFRDGRMTTDKK
jgi:hypothetical protein